MAQSREIAWCSSPSRRGTRGAAGREHKPGDGGAIGGVGFIGTWVLPWRLMLLDDMHKRGVPRPTYQFRHAHLQEHLTAVVPALVS
ncbi:hypothetical protein [Lentzea nigeriaca]|uniref:hypothetical protein n=1 Tax=Lentzea nigeriaca TaxID=1128665 RepID=UPI00195EA016|nr:hypothetical protein [Lentzea nigeriaca]MBM7864998.1 hypothetical protein [Lentzea nigeriaca]